MSVQSLSMKLEECSLLAQVPEAECVLFDNDKVRRPVPDDKAIKTAVEAIKVCSSSPLPSALQGLVL